MAAIKKQLTNGSVFSVETYITDRYKSLLTKAGRGKARFGGVSVKKWAKKIFGNRVFDLYLKWGGIKMLTTATLVPLGLIFSNDYIRSISNKKGGGLIADKIPIIDNEVVGTYLKLAGLSVLSLTPDTLLPLGVIMIIYDLASKYMSGQSGGAITGANVPIHSLQKLDTIANVRPSTGLLTLTPTVPTVAPANKVAGLVVDNNMAARSNSYPPATAVHSDNIMSKSIIGGGSDWLSTHFSRGPVNASDIPEVTFRKFNTTSKIVPNDVSNSPPVYGQHTYEYVPLYAGPPQHITGVGSLGVPANQFGAGYNKIHNPETGRNVKLTSRKGKYVLKKYLEASV
tara:strand:- start:1392 stop:2414 length:1023 start_codon:yes stop_codon:yes gene_type:complete